MKPNSSFTKVIVVTVFILLISSFVAYRSGAFDKILAGQQRNNNQAIAANTITGFEYDTLPKTDSIVTLPRIMSSSKSMVMTDVEYEYILKDGKLKRKLKKKNKNKQEADTVKPPPVMMPSSKSGPMITPRKTTPDTAKHQQ